MKIKLHTLRHQENDDLAKFINAVGLIGSRVNIATYSPELRAYFIKVENVTPLMATELAGVIRTSLDWEVISSWLFDRVLLH